MCTTKYACLYMYFYCGYYDSFNVTDSKYRIGVEQTDKQSISIFIINPRQSPVRVSSHLTPIRINIFCFETQGKFSFKFHHSISVGIIVAVTVT